MRGLNHGFHCNRDHHCAKFFKCYRSLLITFLSRRLYSSRPFFRFILRLHTSSFTPLAAPNHCFFPCGACPWYVGLGGLVIGLSKPFCGLLLQVLARVSGEVIAQVVGGTACVLYWKAGAHARLAAITSCSYSGLQATKGKSFGLGAWRR